VPVVAEVKVIAKREQGVHIQANDIKLGAVDLDSSIAYWLSEVTYRAVDHPQRGRRGWEKGYPVSAIERRAAIRTVARARRETRRKMTNEHLRRVAGTYKAGSPPSIKRSRERSMYPHPPPSGTSKRTGKQGCYPRVLRQNDPPAATAADQRAWDTRPQDREKVVRYQLTADAGTDPITGRRRQVRRRFTTEREARSTLFRTLKLMKQHDPACG
jgi:hypothetical protein